MGTGKPVEIRAAVAWRSGEFEMQPAQRRLLRGGVPVDVEERVFDLLALLVANHDRAMDQREVTAALWGARPVSDGTLRQLVHKARRVIDDDGDHQHTIRTLHGRSLQWVAPLEMVYAEAATADAPAITPVPTAPAKQTHKPARWLALAAAVVLALTAVTLWVRQLPAPETTSLPRVAIEPFESATGDASLDWIKNGLPGLLGTLVQQGGGLDVLSTTQVAHLWNAKLAQSPDRAARLRNTLGAQALVAGSLHKLAENTFELSLQVTPRVGYHTQKTTLTGGEPSVLAVDAAKRIRNILDPDWQAPPSTPLPHDKFLAEAFARGMDLLLQGKMTQARGLFALCVQNNPDFLPAQLQLGATQLHTGQIEKARKTLHDLLDAAQKRSDFGMAAQALNRLCAVNMFEQKFALALADAQRAVPLALRSGDRKIQAVSAMYIVKTASRLSKLDLAGHELAHARDLIERHSLKSLYPTLYNSESYYAVARGDMAGREAADRASLRFSEAAGNESNALSSRYNVANDLQAQGRVTQAIPLLQRVYVDAKSLHDVPLEWYAAYTLGGALVAGGADQQANALVDELLPLTVRHKKSEWQWLTLTLRASIQLYRDDPKAALTTYRQAQILVDPAQSPLHALQLLACIAGTAYSVDSVALPTIARKADAIMSTQKNAAALAYSQHLLQAIVAASAGKRAQSLAYLQAAATAAHPEDKQENNLRSVAFMLGKTDKAAALIATKDLDIAMCDNAPLLRDYAEWAESQGDIALQQRIEDRIAALRKATLAAFSSQDSATHQAVAGLQH